MIENNIQVILPKYVVEAALIWFMIALVYWFDFFTIRDASVPQSCRLILQSYETQKMTVRGYNNQ